MYKQVYIAIDLHSNHSVIGYMNKEGKYLEQKQFKTSAKGLIAQIVAIPAETKYLTIEQSNMSHWAASQLNPYVDKLIICDPRCNRLVSGMDTKDDQVDTYRLCQLLRLNAVKPIYSSGQMGKRQLKRIKFLADQKRQQRQRFEQTAKDEGYTETGKFMGMPGIKVVRAHTFSAYLQTPHRFTNRRQLIKFSRLAVRHHTSDGRSLRAERLSKAGHSSLKNLSHGAWKSAMQSDNEISGFYQASLARCGNPDHARLNTQRKIIITLWSLWKHNRSYRSDKFYSASGVTTD